MKNSGVCVYIASTIFGNWKKTNSYLVNIRERIYGFKNQKCSGHERKNWWTKTYVHMQIRVSETIHRVTARKTQAGRFWELFVGWLLSLYSWNYILLSGFWLMSKFLFILSQLMKLRSSDCMLFTQVILIINCFFRKKVGPRARINFGCNSYETFLIYQNINAAITDTLSVVLRNGRFILWSARHFGAGNCFLGNVRNWKTKAVELKTEREF